MKMMVEVPDQGLASLIGQRVLVFCMRYNYTGILKGANTDDIMLVDAKMVFDTGKFTDKNWACAEAPKSDVIYLRTSAIESYVALPNS